MKLYVFIVHTNDGVSSVVNTHHIVVYVQFFIHFIL